MTLEVSGSAAFAVVLLVGLVFVKYSGYAKSGKGLGYILASALFFFLHAGTEFGIWSEIGALASVQGPLSLLWGLLGWLLLLGGVLLTTMDLTKG